MIPKQLIQKLEIDPFMLRLYILEDGLGQQKQENNQDKGSKHDQKESELQIKRIIHDKSTL